jgi:putative transposase
VCSIAYYAIREKLLSVSLATWYMYNKKLGIKRSAVPEKKRYRTGITAAGQNQIWHADITIVKTKDNIKHYVYLLMDNFSKYVLSWRIESYVSGKVRVDTIREAYNKFVKGSHPVILITDGGPENDNNEMKTFVDGEGVRINLAIALKDIPFSNSVIEAQNRLFKYGYLFQQEYNNFEELKKVFAYDVIDYNDIRPHISLRGCTPEEVHKGLNGIEAQRSEQMVQARKNRLLVNRRALCEICK